MCVSKALQHDKWGAGGKCGRKHVSRLHVPKAVCGWATCLFVWRYFSYALNLIKTSMCVVQGAMCAHHVTRVHTM
jgi:hypothetical protein